MDTQIVYFLGAIVLVLIGILVVQNVVLFGKVTVFITEATANFGGILNAIYLKTPEDVQKIGAGVETITDIAKQLSIKYLGSVDNNKVTQLVSAIEAAGDAIFGVGESEPDADPES